MFADDLVIISDNKDTLQRAFHELNKIIPSIILKYLFREKNGILW
jgi:hypothetical protein